MGISLNSYQFEHLQKAVKMVFGERMRVLSNDDALPTQHSRDDLAIILLLGNDDELMDSKRYGTYFMKIGSVLTRVQAAVFLVPEIYRTDLTTLQFLLDCTTNFPIRSEILWISNEMLDDVPSLEELLRNLKNDWKFQLRRFKLTSHRKDHYDIATKLVKNAKFRLHIIERTPSILLQEEQTTFEKQWKESILDAVRRDVKEIILIFVAETTSFYLKKNPDQALYFKNKLMFYKQFESERNDPQHFFRIHVVPKYFGSFIISDDNIGIWYKSKEYRLETGLYVYNDQKLAFYYSQLSKRIIGEVSQTVDEIWQQITQFS